MVLAARGQGPAIGGERHGIDLVRCPRRITCASDSGSCWSGLWTQRDRHEDESRQEGRQPEGRDRYLKRMARRLADLDSERGSRARRVNEKSVVAWSIRPTPVGHA